MIVVRIRVRGLQIASKFRQNHPPTSLAQREPPRVTRDDKFARPADNEPLDPVVTSGEMECD
ncbi:hypothetical protein Mal52_09400 [Symmachiella dynata]|uniref:Uncharacterized protein n=1 Tax=Symmachiella dynata TaxID=2527995 RepID=A0A517ZJ44_9PLAN|nr:hypothetical protein Mal52_09400 [Symmachiella dynata]